MMADRRPSGQHSASEQSLFEMMHKKMSGMNDCERETLDKLSGDAWMQVFDPTCTHIVPEARDLGARDFCQQRH
jgi:hypothetical protein